MILKNTAKLPSKKKNYECVLPPAMHKCLFFTFLQMLNIVIFFVCFYANLIVESFSLFFILCTLPN